MTLLIDSPYDGVGEIHYEIAASISGNEAIAHKSQNHNHVRGGFDGDYEVYDYYAGDSPCPGGYMVAEPYTVFQVSSGSQSTIFYPASELGDGGRDPETSGSEGIVYYGGTEFHTDEHVTSMLTTLETGGIDDRLDYIQAVHDNNDEWQPDSEIGGFCIFAHPSGYIGSGLTQWMRWVEDFASVPMETLLGFEIGGRRSSEPGVDNMPINAWLSIVHHLMPTRNSYIIGVDDYGSSDTRTGEQMDRQFTTVLLKDDEFDPSDQTESQRAVAEAFLEGRHFAHRRVEWDPDTEDAPEVPKVTSVDVDQDDLEITIEAKDFDTIEMISQDGLDEPAQVETESPATFQVGFEHMPFVVFRLESNPEAETFTQPFGVTTESDYLGDAELGDATF